MKSIIRKELREHFKVALIGLVILTVMLAVAFESTTTQTLRAATGEGHGASDGLQPLLAKFILSQVAFFCAIFGALLGVLQIYAERHPDLWAFLIHRPIPPGRILGGKIISGLLLYVVGAGLPLLGFVVVASVPGKVAAPFEWAMALPLLALFLSGMVFYLGGLLTGLRKARWFASRGFGLGIPIVVAFGVCLVPEFWHALIILAAASAILGLAVRGSFLTGGHYRAQPIFGKLALVLASAVAVTLLLGLLMALSESLLFQRGDFTYSHFQVLKDGTIVKVTLHGFAGGSEEADIVDLNGRPVLDESTGQPVRWKELQKRLAAPLGAMANFANKQRSRYWTHPGYFSTSRFFAPWRSHSKAIWYLTADGSLVAYHGITRRMIGSMAPPGGSPDETHFLPPTDYAWSYLRDYTQPEVFASARTVYLVDLDKRELKPIFTAKDGDVIGGYASGSSPSFPGAHDTALILTRTSIRLLNVRGTPLLALPYEPPPMVFPHVNIYWLEPTNRFLVHFDPDYFARQKSKGKLLSHIAWINADGSTAKALDLPMLAGTERDDPLEGLFISFVPPAFPIPTWEVKYRTWQILRLVPALLAAGAGWWLGRRHAFSRKANVGWAIFNFLFGLPGFLAFLAVQEWSARESCPGCQKLRVVNRELCEHCGTEFAPPEKTGVEIFEPLVTK